LAQTFVFSAHMRELSHWLVVMTSYGIIMHVSSNVVMLIAHA